MTDPIASESWTYAALAASLLMDVAAVHDSLKAAAAARLYDASLRLPINPNLLEFLVHGVKYCYPMRRGELTRGLVTSYAASPLVSRFPPLPGEPPVWPYSLGVATGTAIEPLHPRAPEAALSDPALAELLVLIDGVREPIARVNAIAAEELAKRFGP